MAARHPSLDHRRGRRGLKPSAAVLLLGLSGCVLARPFGWIPEEDAELARAHTLNAMSYWESGDYTRALDQANRALGLDDDFEPALRVRAMVLMRGRTMDSLDAALDLWEDLDDGTENRWTIQHAVAHQRRADVLRRAQRLELADADTEEAIALYEGVLDADPDDVYALEGFVQVLAASGDWDRCLEAADRYVRHIELSRQGWTRKLTLRGIEAEEERMIRSRIRTNRSKEARWRGLRANILHKTGQPMEAERELRTVLELDPGLVAEYLNRARVRAELGLWLLAHQDAHTFVARSDQAADNPLTREAFAIIREAESHGVSPAGIAQ